MAGELGEKPGNAKDLNSSSTYQQEVNTNLTEISDWLTKIIVGLGLINLQEVRPFLNEISLVLAFGLDNQNPNLEKAFSVGLIVYFSILGFLSGYLITRLYLAGAFSRADQIAIEEGKIIHQQVDEGAEQLLVENPDSWKTLTKEQLEFAEKIEHLASQSDTSIVRNQIIRLSREYERIRSSFIAGDTRTEQMKVVVTKMRAFALAGYSLLRELVTSFSAGERLAAIVMLQVTPNLTYLNWLAERFKVEKPFVGFQAGVALLYSVRKLGPKNYPDLMHSIENAKSTLKEKNLQESDRGKLIDEAQKELQKRIDSQGPINTKEEESQ